MPIIRCGGVPNIDLPMPRLQPLTTVVFSVDNPTFITIVIHYFREIAAWLAVNNFIAIDPVGLEILESQLDFTFETMFRDTN